LSIPYCYHGFLEAFSKAASNKLPLYCLYDYKISLETRIEANLKYSLLYKILLKEFKAMKKYLLNNLNKGFIKASQALFIALVLFIKKINGGLCFCIDYISLT
jgi:hypothetical protein